MIIGTMSPRILPILRTTVVLGPRELATLPLISARGPLRGLMLLAPMLLTPQTTFEAPPITRAIQMAPRYVRGPMPNGPASS